MSAESDAGSRIITVLEAVWSEIRVCHPDVPGVLMTTGAGIRGQRKSDQRWGHFWAEQWENGQGQGPRLSEMFLAGESLMSDETMSGGRRALETLLHEGSHGVAHTRKIRDTSRQGRYHNKEFLKIAVELGLTPPDKPHTTHGFSFATLGDETAEKWAEAIEAIDAAALPYLRLHGLVVTTGDAEGEGDQGGEEGGGEGGKSRAGKRISIGCQCPEARSMPITPKIYVEAPILCGRCKKRFRAAPEWEEELSVTWDDDGNEIED
ncbi:MAG: hypothetical protein AUG49_18830 [Catenulispora sp. 13_1_20CM_3_70_7]|nr:MAG: hypothetical protein AUG49_18830 [Catenulispora sp. 13_1_20CM_3_70_7]